MTALRYDELAAAVGTMLGPSSPLRVSQERINQFAEATGDRQWIHVDTERASSGPFATTIAHGYLTLSLVSAYLEEILDVTGVGTVVNYGSDRVRFPSPVHVGSSLRAAGEIIAVEVGAGWTQVTVHISISPESAARPVCAADVLVRFYPEDGG